MVGKELGRIRRTEMTSRIAVPKSVLRFMDKLAIASPKSIVIHEYVSRWEEKTKKLHISRWDLKDPIAWAHELSHAYYGHVDEPEPSEAVHAKQEVDAWLLVVRHLPWLTRNRAYQIAEDRIAEHLATLDRAANGKKTPHEIYTMAIEMVERIR